MEKRTPYQIAVANGYVGEESPDQKYWVKCPCHDDHNPSCVIEYSDKTGAVVAYCVSRKCEGVFHKLIAKVVAKENDLFENDILAQASAQAEANLIKIESEYNAKYAPLTLADMQAYGCTIEKHTFPIGKAQWGEKQALAYPIHCPQIQRTKWRSFERDANGKRLCMQDKIKTASETIKTGFFLAQNLTPDDRPLIITGGEEKAAVMNKAGLRAVSYSAGEQLPDSIIQWVVALGNRDLRLAYDNDKIGESYQEKTKLLNAIRNAGGDGTVKVVDWKTTVQQRRGYDANDFAKDFGLDKLKDQVLSHAEPKITFAHNFFPELTEFSADIQEEWHINEFFPQGVTLLCAKQGTGKTYLIMQMCNAIANGTNFLGHKCNQSEVLFVSYDMAQRQINNYVLSSCKPNKSSAFRICAKPDFTFSDETVDGLVAYFAQVYPNVKLLVIDTLNDCIKYQTKTALNAYQSDVSVMQPIRRFSERSGVSVVLIHHMNKKGETMGSSGYPSKADHVLLLTEPKPCDYVLRWEKSRSSVHGTETHIEKQDGQWVSAEAPFAFKIGLQGTIAPQHGESMPPAPDMPATGTQSGLDALLANIANN